MKRHLVIGDLQQKKGCPTRHLEWIAQAVNDYKPDVLVQIGDAFDMESLSSHDGAGSLKMEGLRYEDDIAAGNQAFDILNKNITHKCKKYFFYGNHEQRIERAINKDPRLVGTIGYHHLNTGKDWKHVPYESGAPGQLPIDGIMYCLEENHRVLKSDLSYVPLKTLQVGDELVAFDEEPRDGEIYRQYRKAVVERVALQDRKLMKVVLSDGKVFLTTPEHQWLASDHKATGIVWMRTDQLRPGISHVVKVAEEWESDSSYESGYLAGLLDGEGHVSRSNSSQGGLQLGFAQKENNCLKKALEILDKLQIPYKIYPSSSGVMQVRFTGLLRDKLKILGKYRPERLLNNLRGRVDQLGRLQRTEPATVVSVEDAGVGRVAVVQTSTGTMIVEGYAHHNCHFFANPNTGKPIGGTIQNRLKNIGQSFVQGHVQGLSRGEFQFATGRTINGTVCGSSYLHDEGYKGAANFHWRGIVVLNEVENGGYTDMALSLDYLCRKYEGMSVSRFLNKNYRDAKSRFSLARGE